MVHTIGDFYLPTIFKIKQDLQNTQKQVLSRFFTYLYLGFNIFIIPKPN